MPLCSARAPLSRGYQNPPCPTSPAEAQSSCERSVRCDRPSGSCLTSAVTCKTKPICIAFGDTAADRRTSATAKPPPFTGTHSLFCLNAIIQAHFRAVALAFPPYSYLCANHARTHICVRIRVYAFTSVFPPSFLVQARTTHVLPMHAKTHADICMHRLLREDPRACAHEHTQRLRCACATPTRS